MGEFNYAVIGRLKDGVTPGQAVSELNVLQVGLVRAANEKVDLKALVIPLLDAVVGRARRGLLLLLGAIVGVLLIACANLANLSLTRTVGRLREAAIRTALGASRSRLIWRVVIEQLALAVAGGGVGVIIAQGALAVFVRTAPIDLPRVDDIALDGHVLVFAAVVTLVAGLAVALLPAARVAGRDVQQALRAGGLATTGDRRGRRTRASLLAGQVALSVTLLVVTALLVVSLARLLQVNPGFDARGVLDVQVALPAHRYGAVLPRLAVYDRILESMRTLPGIDSAAWISTLPLTGESWVDLISLEGDTRPPLQRPLANYRFISPDYFKVLSIPVTRGRSFAEVDRDPNRATIPALVSERTAERVWPRGDPLGQRFWRTDSTDAQPFEVVGIVPDVRTQLASPPPVTVFVPYWFRSRLTASLVIRVVGDPASVTHAIQQAMWRVDPEIAIAEMRPLAQLRNAALSGPLYQVELFVAFGGVALLIALIGVYATTAYEVSRRRREMNIRVALGARVSEVVGLVVRQGFWPVLAGLAAGVAGAVATGAIVSSLLFEVRARDPLITATTAALVGGVAWLTGAWAARRGVVIDLVSALREE